MTSLYACSICRAIRAASRLPSTNSTRIGSEGGDDERNRSRLPMRSKSMPITVRSLTKPHLLVRDVLGGCVLRPAITGSPAHFGVLPCRRRHLASSTDTGAPLTAAQPMRTIAYGGQRGRPVSSLYVLPASPPTWAGSPGRTPAGHQAPTTVAAPHPPPRVAATVSPPAPVVLSAVPSDHSSSLRETWPPDEG